MVNAILAMIVSFFSPVAAFIILSLRIIMLRSSVVRFMMKKAAKEKAIIAKQKEHEKKK